MNEDERDQRLEKNLKVERDITQFIRNRDQFAKEIGIQLIHASEGRAQAALFIEARHLNGVGTVHGGALFTLADLAFAAACNTRGQVAVAVNATIAFTKAVSSGKLEAEAVELSLHPKLSTYLVTIRDEKKDTVAIFQGTAYRKKDKWPFE